jgi:uncharacterized protein (TIGR04222 family)
MVPGLTTMTGGQFILLYMMLLAAAAPLSLILAALTRSAGRTQRVDDPDQLAMLSGGKARLIDSAIARLLETGAIAFEGRQHFRIDRTRQSANLIDGPILRLTSPVSWNDIKSASSVQADCLEDGLVGQGLIASNHEMLWRRGAAVLPFVLLLMVGLMRLAIGLARHAPVGILIVLLIGTIGFTLFRWFMVDRRTQAAIKAVSEAKARATRLKTAPLDTEMGIAVALFGTAVLTGSAFGALHQLRTASHGDGGPGFFDGGSSDGGGSDGGGGGCGGGCGGCGS